MDRLTRYKNGVCVYAGPGCKYPETGEIPAEMETGSVRAVLQKLAEYEDTGLMPEEIADFQKNYQVMSARFADYKALEAQGRLVVLPCKVADTVYTIESIYNGRKYAGEKVVSAMIDHVTIGGTTGQPVFDLCTETGGWFYSMEPGQFCLTREEAERALEERGKNHEP